MAGGDDDYVHGEGADAVADDVDVDDGSCWCGLLMLVLVMRITVLWMFKRSVDDDIDDVDVDDG